MAKLDADAVWDFAKAIRQTMPAESQKRQATVQSVDDDGTVWVQVAGAEDVTPIATSNANVQPGDVVNVEQRGASLHVEGNITDPSVGERGVERVVAPVRASLSRATDDADAAKLAAKAAQEAAEAASAANQHFWDDTNGAHVTEYEKDAWTDPTSESYHAGHNMLLNSLGLLFRKAMNNLASFTQSAVAFFDGSGNEAGNVVASFGANGAQIGRADKSHLVMDYHSMKMVDSDGVTYFHASDLRDEDGAYIVTESFIGDGTKDFFKISYRWSDEYDYPIVKVDGVEVEASYTEFPDTVEFDAAPDGSLVEIIYTTTDSKAKAYTVGVRDAEAEVGFASYAEGLNVISSGNVSHAEGTKTAATSTDAHAEGSKTTASGGASHSEGASTTASGTESHAEGLMTTASGPEAHAEGYWTTASGSASHAEGRETTASGGYSHVEGFNNVASGSCSHAGGFGTEARGKHQTAIGQWNRIDQNDEYAFIVGNGTSDNAGRKNAYTLDWNGNGEYAGAIDLNGGLGRLGFGTDQLTIYIDPDGTERTQWGIMKSTSGNPYLRYRKYENGAWGSWQSAFVHAQASRTANTVLAAPNGSNGTASFRKLVPDDVSGLGDTESKDISTAVQSSTSSWTSVGSIALTEGTWVIIGGLQFASNANGYRYISLNDSNGTPAAAWTRATRNSVTAISGNATVLHTSHILTVAASGRTVHLMGWQNSGGNVNLTGSLRAVRVG